VQSGTGQIPHRAGSLKQEDHPVRAFVVSKEHIDILVQLAFTGPRSVPHSSHWERPSWLMEHHPLPDEVGRMLLLECLKSVGHRYPDDRLDELPRDGPPYWTGGVDAYRYAPQPCRLTAVEGLKAVACYEYQSCEHDAWPESRAYTFCRSLRGALIHALPGMDEAPWGWDAERVAAAAAALLKPEREDCDSPDCPNRAVS
jgi:hypothetical protein